MAKVKKSAGKAGKAAASGRAGRGGKAERAAKGASEGKTPDEVAYERALAAIEAVAAEDAIIPRYDVFDAATVALRLADQAARWRAELEALDAVVAGTSGSLEELELYARALRFIRTGVEETQNVENRVTVPEHLVDEVDTLRRRMIAVLEYNLGDQPEMAATLAFLRQGQGHQDRVNDLQALAKHYDANAKALAKDTAKYEAKDARRARDLAAKVQALIDKEKVASSARWVDLQARANALLLTAHDRVRRAVVFLDERAAFDTYASLHAAARALTGRASTRSAPDDEAPTHGTPAPAPNGTTSPS